MTDKQAEVEILSLRKKIEEAEAAYHRYDQPIMIDKEFDLLYSKLQFLEEEFPQFKDELSPTARIGSDLDSRLPEQNHTIPVLSLDKCYSSQEFKNWINKVSGQFPGKIEITIEPKIDGAGVVLYYKNGGLYRALTRGNGYVGNDITENIKTIRAVPLRISYKGDLAVRGEVYIEKNDFKEYNSVFADGEYANPRNLASGSVRRIKSSETAKVPLNIFIYEAYTDDGIFNSHLDSLIFLKENGFRINSHLGFFSSSIEEREFFFENMEYGKIEESSLYLEKFSSIRESLSYEIDGLVVKINNLNIREELGFTKHHPRWAIAYKFDAPLAETVINNITVQIGRGGRATPVAELESVSLSGSTISRATLHNQDYINSLGVNIGDKVAVSKRGDVIPAVELVVEKGEHVSPFALPAVCPECSSELVKDGSHIFCPNTDCPKRVLGTLQFFVSRNQMDIESLGDKTLEFLFNNSFIKTIPDIYEFDYNRINGMDGYADKKISKIIESVNLSKNKSFITVLSSLGLKDLGEKTVELLVNKYSSIELIIEASLKNDISLFTDIHGIGENTAYSIIKHFSDKKNIEIIERLKLCGLSMEYKKSESNEVQFMAGTKWVVTGSFDSFKPRDLAVDEIKKYGGEIQSAISGKTDYLLCGSDAGSKLDKAKKLNVKIINEEDFILMLQEKKFLKNS